MKLEFSDKLEPQRLEFGLLRWNNLSMWNSSFLNLSSIKIEVEELDTKKNKEIRQMKKTISRSEEEQRLEDDLELRRRTK